MNAVAAARQEPARQRVLLVAGEASGDGHAAALVAKLQQLAPGTEVFGMGGSKLRAAGMDTIVDSEKTAGVMGLVEVVGSIGGLLQARKQLLAACDLEKPDLAVLVDFPDFNLLLARALHRRGIPVLYFISPQLWAWRRGRVEQIRKFVRKVATIFPFEETFYRNHGIAADYVGHPFLDRAQLSTTRDQFWKAHSVDPERSVVALLPGSRTSEISRLLAPMLQAFRLLQKRHPEVQAVLPVAPSLERAAVEQLLGPGHGVTLIDGHAREILSFADASVVASGTATVEAALGGNPFVVIYKLSPLTYYLSRLLVRGVNHFAMVNVIAGRAVVPELLQRQVTPEAIAGHLESWLERPEQRERIRCDLVEVCDQLVYRGTLSGSAGERTAQLALDLMQEAAAHG